MVLINVHSFCDASIVTLLVDESNDKDGDPTSNNSTTGKDIAKPAAKTVDTGGPIKEFLVHENLLCGASPVLKAAFQGHFVEIGTKSMTIKGLDSEMVNELLRWLYRGKRLPEKLNTEAAERLWYCNMVRLSVVADIYQIEGLEDEIVDRLILHAAHKQSIAPPQMPVAKLIYENTSQKSQLRKWFVAWYTEKIDSTWYCRETTDLVPFPELANDIAKAFGRQKSKFASKSFFDMSREERKAPLPVPPP